MSQLPPDIETIPEDDQPENQWLRLLWLIIIAMLISAANTAHLILAALQFILTLVNKGERNRNIAELGRTLGDWMNTAIRYQTAASSQKPWPWTSFD